MLSRESDHSGAYIFNLCMSFQTFAVTESSDPDDELMIQPLQQQLRFKTVRHALGLLGIAYFIMPHCNLFH